MYDVVAIGELLVDFACRSTDDDGYPVLAAHPGGAPANFLAVLARYGLKTALLAKVGNDAFGRLLRRTMEREGIDLFTSAADTIARDGHIANKIGTFQIAILAKYFGVPYYVTGIPDQDKHSKDDIVIEMRDPQQVLSYRGLSLIHI